MAKARIMREQPVVQWGSPKKLPSPDGRRRVVTGIVLAKVVLQHATHPASLAVRDGAQENLPRHTKRAAYSTKTDDSGIDKSLEDG